MKRLVLTVISIVLFIALYISSFDALVLSPMRRNERLAHLRAQTLAQTMADALGRTPSNSIVEFESCGMFDCVYNIYFHTPDGFADMNARVLALGKINLRVVTGAEIGGPGPLLNVLNGALNTTRIRGRLSVTSGTYTEPGYSDWFLHNEKDELISIIDLYVTKDKGVTYMFDGKSIPNNNIVYLHTLVNPSKD